MYTNGTLANAENLRALGEGGAGRAALQPGRVTSCADRVIENMATAKAYIPRVGVETPMTPELFAAFFRKKEAILAAGVDFHELRGAAPERRTTWATTAGENLYVYRRMGYVSPVWSRELDARSSCAAAAERSIGELAVHDCCNRTKFARDLNLRAKEGGWFGASSYGLRVRAACPTRRSCPSCADPRASRSWKEEPLPEGYRPGDVVL